MKNTTAFICFVIFIFTACQKDITSDIDPVVTPPLPQDSTLLALFIGLDATAVPPQDTIAKTYFYYDSNKRNTSIDLVYYDNGIPSEYQYHSTLFYQGTDTLPYKRSVITNAIPTSNTDYVNDTCYYYYNNLKLVKDSAIFPSPITRQFQYTSNQVITTTTDYYNPQSPYIYKDTVSVAYQNGNIISQVNTSVATAKQNFKFVYDNHPNPFARTQNKIAIDNRFPYYYMEAFVSEIFGTHNPLEIDQTQQLYNYHYKFTYEYNQAGYPKIINLFDQNDPSVIEKGLYFYTK
ncbi:MAG: hypothetical protein ABJB11_22890 [Ferruginibacter sp.]